MMHLANNYTYRYIKDDTSVYAICRSITGQTHLPGAVHGITPPIRNYTKAFYSEPFMNSNGHVNNAVFAFIGHDVCRMWDDKLQRNGILSIGMLQDLEDIDRPAVNDQHPNNCASTNILEVSLHELKIITDAMQMPLMVVLEAQNDKYEVFYHSIKHKQKNG